MSELTVIEILQNAVINCDNVVKMNMPELAKLVREQIESAIEKLIETENSKETEND